MTELNSSSNQRPGAGVKRISRDKLKTDMTPMVDLGFLLITFFVVTAELSKPHTMNLYMPSDGSPTPIKESSAITILAGSNNKLFYYYGTEEEAIKNNTIVQTTRDEKNGLGKIIRDKQEQLDRQPGGRKEMVVLIKPGRGSTYENTVDLLDEMIVHRVTRYAIVKPGFGDILYLERNK